MKDIELYELAAKAAGVPLKKDFADRADYYMTDPLMWNPLTDDGDALRLAVKLDIRVTPGGDGPYAVAEWWKRPALTELDFVRVLVEGDGASATRRAIVQAAAAMTEPTNG